MFKDTQVAVESADMEGITFRVGTEGFAIAYDILEQMKNGADAIETLKHNMGIRLDLAGVDVRDPIAVQSVIESVTFKFI